MEKELYFIRVTLEKILEALLGISKRMRDDLPAPTFDTDEGSGFSTVTISCADEGATIHYTIDGSEPTESSHVYASPLSITEATILKAIATKLNCNNSAIATEMIPVEGTLEEEEPIEEEPIEEEPIEEEDPDEAEELEEIPGTEEDPEVIEV